MRLDTNLVTPRAWRGTLGVVLAGLGGVTGSRSFAATAPVPASAPPRMGVIASHRADPTPQLPTFRRSPAPVPPNGHSASFTSVAPDFGQGDLHFGQFAAYPLALQAPQVLGLRKPTGRPAAREVFTAIQHRDLPKLQALLARGLSVEARGFHKQTPLMAAAQEGWGDGVRLLLDRHADVRAVDEEGRPALAFGSRRLEIVQLLLGHGASPNVRGYSTRAPLLMEVLFGGERADVARALVEAGADVNAGASATYTPLHAAVLFGSAELVEVILHKGAKAEARDGDGNTPLLLALAHGKPGTVAALLEAGADVNAASKRGETALHRAATGQNELLLSLIEKGAKLEAKRDNGWTPLISAAVALNSRGVELLLRAGANPNARSATGQTALMFAARFGQAGMARLLLDQGADPSLKDRNGATALSIAREGTNLEGIRLLEAAAAARH